MTESQKSCIRHGFFENVQLNGVTEVYPRPTLVAVAMKNFGFYIEQLNYCVVYGKMIGQNPCSTEHGLSCY